jgi:hypothetical protein
MKAYIIMSKFILFVFINLFITQSLFSQSTLSNKFYTEKWKSIENYLQNGLNASAEKDILEVFNKAKKEKNTVQLIKSICHYRAVLRDRDEEAEENTIIFFEKELNEADFPAKQFLHSMLAELYWKYYQNNSWKILSITPVSGNEIKQTTSSINTWSADQFFAKAYHHYLASIQDIDRLSQYSLEPFTDIIDPGMNTQKLRPTLYSFLIHRAIQYFSSEENEITKPAYSFEINDSSAFLPVKQFIKSTFKTSDTNSKKYQTLLLYQQLLTQHINDSEPSALIDADIARIKYVHQHAVLSNKDQLYFKALENISRTYPNHEIAAMASYLMAETFVQNRAQTWSPRYNKKQATQDDKNDYVAAKELITPILNRFPNSEAGIHAKQLLLQIESKNLQLQTEKVVIPGQSILARVDYRNITTIHGKIIPLNQKEYHEYSRSYEPEKNQLLINKKGIKNWTIELPITNDYKQHSTEIRLEALTPGVYAVAISNHPNFNKNSPMRTIISSCI